MAGLIDMAREQAAPTSGQAPAAPMDDDAMANASPEEQAVYEQFVKNGMEVIYPAGEEGQVSPKILESLKAGGDPVQSLAATTVELVVQLETSAEASGAEWAKNTDLVSDISLGAGQEFMGQLAEIAETAGIHTYTPDEVNAAAIDAMQQYGEAMEAAGKIDKADLESQFGEIAQAKEQGRLGELMPALAQDAPAAGPEQAREGMVNG